MDSSYEVDLSLVIPVKNESGNLPLLFADIVKVMAARPERYEIVFIEDGSTDDSYAVLARLKQQNPGLIRLIKFERNFGKSAALAAGFERARGEYIIIMDADRQNDPVDIPKFLDAVRQYDIVCGYRQKRLDNWFRLAQSRIANRIRNWFTHDGIRDSGCGYQALRRACLGKIRLYGGMHRFLPCLFKMEGFQLGQVPVLHHPRTVGVSNYFFWTRLRRSLLDLLAVRWMIYRHIAYRVSEEK